MAEGDTIYRLARQLRPLVGQRVTAARARPGPRLRRVPDLSRIEGAMLTSVESRGKQLLIGFDNGLTIRSHLRMNGSWRRYRPGEASTGAVARATATIEMPAGTLVALNVPVVELLTQAELRRSRPLVSLGPDLLADDFDIDEAMRRLRARNATALGEALLDQRVVAGIGNVYKSEVAYLERLDPWAPVSAYDDERLRAGLLAARRLLQANVDEAARTTTGRRGPGTRLWVYGRAGRACRRCGTAIRSRRQGEQARTTYWCPSCQAASPGANRDRPASTAPTRHDGRS